MTSYLKTESSTISQYASKHLAISEDSLRKFFGHKVHHIQFEEIWKLLGNLGHVIIPSSKENRQCKAHGAYKIPTIPPKWSTPFPPFQLPIHDEDQEQQEPVIAAEKHDKVMLEEEGEEGHEGHEGHEEEDEEYEEDGDMLWKYHGNKYEKDKTRVNLMQQEMYAGYDEYHPSNSILMDWYKVEKRKKPPMKEQDRPGAYYAAETTKLHHMACFLLYTSTKRLTEPGCPNLTLDIIFEGKEFIYDWLSAAIDAGIGAENLRKRSDALKSFYRWLQGKHMKGVKYKSLIDDLINAVNYAVAMLQPSIDKLTPTQQLYLDPDIMKTVAQVMRYKTHPNYISEIQNLREFLESDDNLQTLKNEGLSNDEHKRYFALLVGSILAHVCLQQCQRPCVIYNMEVYEFKNAMRSKQKVGDIRVVYVSKHKSGKNKTKPATFTIGVDEEWKFLAWHNYFRPLVSKLATVDDSHLWLLNTQGCSLRNQVSKALAKWQTTIYDKEILHATVTEARRAMQTEANDCANQLDVDERDQVMNFLSHSKRVVRDKYNKATLTKVVNASNTVRNFVDKMVQQASNFGRDGDKTTPMVNMIPPMHKKSKRATKKTKQEAEKPKHDDVNTNDRSFEQEQDRAHLVVIGEEVSHAQLLGEIAFRERYVLNDEIRLGPASAKMGLCGAYSVRSALISIGFPAPIRQVTKGLQAASGEHKEVDWFSVETVMRYFVNLGMPAVILKSADDGTVEGVGINLEGADPENILAVHLFPGHWQPVVPCPQWTHELTPLFGQIEIVKHVSAGEMLDGDDTLSATLRLETGRQYYDIFGSNVVTEGETHPDQDHMISSDNNDDESNIMGVTDDHQIHHN